MKITLTIVLLLVFYQDVKERLVYWFLFPIIAICSGILLYQNMILEVFKTVLVINVIFVSFLILVVLVYSKLKLKMPISDTFGLGDALLFFALAFTFSSVSFFVLFVSGLIFSLLLHLFMKRKSKYETVPLAGYMSLFFVLAYVSHWMGLIKSVYII